MKRHITVIKQALFLCFITLIGSVSIQAQYVVPGRSIDILAQPVYKSVNKENMKMTASALANHIPLEKIESVINKEYKNLTTYNPQYVVKGIRINKFITKRSYDFIKEKYPILDPRGDEKEFLYNSTIRNRYKFMLMRELKKAKSYLALDNYMSEGDRILLLLSSIEKVMNTCIKLKEDERD